MKKPRNDGDFPFWRLWLIAQWILLAALLLFVVFTVRGQQPAPEPVALSLRQAVDAALAPGGSLQVQIARQLTEQAKARIGQARADLLPNVDGSVSQSSQTRNLQAMGIDFSLPVPGFEVPRFVGPFSVFDARLSATQSLFHFSAIRRYQAAKAGAGAAAAQEAQVRELVTVAVAKAYYALQRAQAQHHAAVAALNLARELEQLAIQQKEAGTGLALEVTRAAVQRSQAEQVVLVREAERNAARLQLLRTLGASLDASPASVESMLPPMEEPPTVEAALAIAMGEREDLRGQRARQHSAQLLHSSSKWESAPQVLTFGDYGVNGNTPGSSLPTRAVGVMARIPVFDGGRRDGRRAEAKAKLLEEELRTRDLEQQVELDLRLALDALQSTRRQIDVATDAETQASTELGQARRRYEAGVSSSLDVTRAQSALESARASRIDALYRYHLARADFALATGRADMLLP
jgi:outer membrane protein